MDELPEWFGIAEANADYATAANLHPTTVATVDDHPVGLTTIVRHFDVAAEVHLMAVVPDRHRQGVGAAMLRFVEDDLVRQGVEFLQVKTLADTHLDPGYAETRRFYRAMGFTPLEVHPELWDIDNPALQMVKYLNAPKS